MTRSDEPRWWHKRVEDQKKEESRVSADRFYTTVSSNTNVNTYDTPDFGMSNQPEYTWTSNTPVFDPTRRITDVSITQETESIDVSTIDGGPQTISTPGKIRILDQHGFDVPDELAAKIKRVLQLNLIHGEQHLLESQIRKCLADWNKKQLEPSSPQEEERQVAFQEEHHRSGCSYRGTYYYACTCQPPTIWGPTRLWLCECCKLPRSPEHLDLCTTCKGHEYSDPVAAQIDHEAMTA